MQLSLILSNTSISYNRLQTHPDELLHDLDFADDIVLWDQDEMEALEYFWAIESSAKKIGLSINYKDKTKRIIKNIKNLIIEVIDGKSH